MKNWYVNGMNDDVMLDQRQVYVVRCVEFGTYVGEHGRDDEMMLKQNELMLELESEMM